MSTVIINVKTVLLLEDLWSYFLRKASIPLAELSLQKAPSDPEIGITHYKNLNQGPWAIPGSLGDRPSTIPGEL